MAEARPAKRVGDHAGSGDQQAVTREMRLVLGAAELAASCGCGQPTIGIVGASRSNDSSTVRDALTDRGIRTFDIPLRPVSGVHSLPSLADRRTDPDWVRHACAIVDTTDALTREADQLAARHRLPVVHARPAVDRSRTGTTETCIADVLRYRLHEEKIDAGLNADTDAEPQPGQFACSTIAVVPASFKEGKLRLRLGTQVQDPPPGSGVKVSLVGSQLEVRLVPPFGDTHIWRRTDVTIVQESGRHTLYRDDIQAGELASGLTVELGARALHRHCV